MRRLLLLLLLPILTAGCATTSRTASHVAPPPAVATTTTAPATAATTPASPTLPAGVHWTRNSAEHRAAFLQAYRLASVLVDAAATGREPGSWAVVLDADETVIDNSQAEKEKAAAGVTTFDPVAWNAWVERRAAVAEPGARAFLEHVRRLGGKIAIVTNRTVAQCPATEDTLQAQRLAYDLILCKGAESTKDGRWRSIEDGTAAPGLPPLPIVLFVGDNILDFPGVGQADRSGPEPAFESFGRRFVILPNPMYGSWEKNPQD